MVEEPGKSKKRPARTHPKAERYPFKDSQGLPAEAFNSRLMEKVKKPCPNLFSGMVSLGSPLSIRADEKDSPNT